MSNTRVVHVNDNVPGAVYIGRGNPRTGRPASQWANPFKITDRWEIGNGGVTRADVIEMYQTHITLGAGRYLLAELPTLRGKALACWCCHDGEERTPRNACHGHVLVDLLDQYSDDELRAMAGDAS